MASPKDLPFRIVDGISEVIKDLTPLKRRDIINRIHEVINAEFATEQYVVVQKLDFDIETTRSIKRVVDELSLQYTKTKKPIIITRGELKRLLKVKVLLNSMVLKFKSHIENRGMSAGGFPIPAKNGKDDIVVVFAEKPVTDYTTFLRHVRVGVNPFPRLKRKFSQMTVQPSDLPLVVHAGLKAMVMSSLYRQKLIKVPLPDPHRFNEDTAPAAYMNTIAQMGALLDDEARNHFALSAVRFENDVDWMAFLMNVENNNATKVIAYVASKPTPTKYRNGILALQLPALTFENIVFNKAYCIGVFVMGLMSLTDNIAPTKLFSNQHVITDVLYGLQMLVASDEVNAGEDLITEALANKFEVALADLNSAAGLVVDSAKTSDPAFTWCMSEVCFSSVADFMEDLLNVYPALRKGMSADGIKMVFETFRMNTVQSPPNPNAPHLKDEGESIRALVLNTLTGKKASEEVFSPAMFGGLSVSQAFLVGKQMRQMASEMAS